MITTVVKIFFSTKLSCVQHRVGAECLPMAGVAGQDLVAGATRGHWYSLSCRHWAPPRGQDKIEARLSSVMLMARQSRALGSCPVAFLSQRIMTPGPKVGSWAMGRVQDAQGKTVRDSKVCECPQGHGSSLSSQQRGARYPHTLHRPVFMWDLQRIAELFKWCNYRSTMPRYEENRQGAWHMLQVIQGWVDKFRLAMRNPRVQASCWEGWLGSSKCLYSKCLYYKHLYHTFFSETLLKSCCNQLCTRPFPNSGYKASELEKKKIKTTWLHKTLSLFIYLYMWGGWGILGMKIKLICCHVYDTAFPSWIKIQ